jgi:2'-5' RNA ligase
MTSPATSSSDQAARLRLFVAVAVPDPIRTAIDDAAVPLRESVPGLRWTDPQSWHLTLAFLGGVPRERLGPIEDIVGQAAAGAHPFTLRLSGTAGTFSGGGGGVLWVGLEPAPMLDELAEGLRRDLSAMAPEVDAQPFQPHLTLARSTPSQRVSAELAERYSGPRFPWTVRRLALMRSRLAVGGARYGVWAEWPLE